MLLATDWNVKEEHSSVQTGGVLYKLPNLALTRVTWMIQRLHKQAEMT